ncbi:MAG: glycosyltransferase [Myxococcota bacterium]|jgi:spore maturation protein CgeB|nr:glycosyltransferase [Myxococcota bacterium]
MASISIKDTGLKAALSYPKFERQPYRAIVIDSEYHLQKEAISTLPKLGCEVFTLKTHKDQPVGDWVRSLLTALVTHKPDFIFTVNHFGFDDGGQIGDLLEQLEMPVAVWYVDSPLFILKQASFPAPNVTRLFLWERTLEPVMRKKGAKHVHYLPLATDPAKFELAQRPKIDKPITFVGDSMAHAQRKAKKNLSKQGKALAEELAQKMVEGTRFDTLLDTVGPIKPPPGDDVWDIWELATWTATAKKRLQIVRALAGSDLHLYGDDGWKTLVPNAKHHGPVNYGQDLAKVYASSAIVLNATSCQMPTAVNQRVFDVPVAGGFVLSDAQPDMFELFKVGEEAVVYEGVEELRWQVGHWKEHLEETRDVVAIARKRVSSFHTYQQRFDSIAEELKGRARRMI